jgi:hypothetical protein
MVGRRPPSEATPARRRSGPPKRLFGFENDVAPGQADIVQVTVAQFSELTPLLLALPPDMEGLAELGEKPRTMMIYHRFMRESGHLRLLKLICCS